MYILQGVRHYGTFLFNLTMPTQAHISHATRYVWEGSVLMSVLSE